MPGSPGGRTRAARSGSSSSFRSLAKFLRVEVYWFDDTGHGGCRVPKSWQVLCLDGPDWKPVAGPRTEPVEKDRFNVTRFTPVRTEALRLVVQLQPEMSGGVLECRVP